MVSIISILYLPVRFFRLKILRRTKIKKILVVAIYHGLGNLLCLIPMLNILKERFPEAKLSVLVGYEPGLVLFNKQPFLDEVIFFDRKKSDLYNGIKFFRKQICPRNFDLSIFPYLGNDFYFSIWPWFAGIKFRIAGTKNNEFFRWSLLNTYVVEMDFDKHEVEQNLDLVDVLNLERKNFNPSITLFIPEAPKVFAHNFLKERDIFPEDLVLGVAAGSGVKSKRWPLENFVDACEKIQIEQKIKVVFFFGPDESGLKESLLKFKKDFVIAEGLNILQVAALVRRCNLFLSNDNGLMHLASCLGVPVVAIFGPTIAKRDAPWMTPHRIVRSNLSCSPCYGFSKISCQNYRCLKLISSKEVYSSLVDLFTEIFQEPCIK